MELSPWLHSIKQSKHGVLKQVVPGYTIKNKYDSLWDSPARLFENNGYTTKVY